jgi:polyhydroxybutyrate depolymerase
MSFRSHLVIAIAVSAALAAARAPAQAGSYRREELVVDGVARELFVYTPAKLAAERSPVVIAFHGFQSDASGLRWIAKIDRFADAAGFIVVYPNAVDKSWNAGRGSGSTNRSTDDAGFARALLAAVATRADVDAERMYAMGFSNGAQMVATIVCTLDHQLAAAAMVAHSLNIPDCEPRARVPILLIQGRKDPFVPFDGGGKSDLKSHAFTVDFFREINDAVAPPKPVLERDSIRCTQSDDREGREQVVECVGERDGHTWPGGVVFQPEVFGPTNTELAGTEYIFQFFARHPRPAPSRGLVRPSAAASSADTASAAPPAAALVATAAPSGGREPPLAALSPAPARWQEYAVTLPSGATRRYFEPRAGLAEARLLVLVFPDGAAGPDAVAATLGLDRSPPSLGYVVTDAELAASVGTVVEQVRNRTGAALPVAVIGLGAGGAAAQQLFCERADLVSAVVLIAASFQGPPCWPRPVPSLLSVLATADPRAPADGDAKRALLSLAELRVAWRNDVVSSLYPSVQAGPGYSCQSERRLQGEPELRTCRVDGSSPVGAAATRGAFDPAVMIAEFLGRHIAHPEIFTIVHAH